VRGRGRSNAWCRLDRGPDRLAAIGASAHMSRRM
jgi:hypothetical protein